MAKRQNFVVGSTNPVTVSKTQSELNNGWNKYQVLKAGDLDGIFNAVSDYSNDSSNEIANAIQALTGAQPTGASQNELAGALQQMREDIETSSLTFKGYVATSAPSSSTYALVEGNLWINSATMPTSFPVVASSIKQWNGTSWVNYGSTYTPADFDFFRNINDNEGYYWFGGQWTVMSTDMSTTYFTLNQTSGKWEIKSSVNLPGRPTTTTPTSGSPDNQIATKKYVDDAIAPLPTTTYFPDVFDRKWSDYILSNPRWLRADDFAWHNSSEGPVAYQHLVDDKNDTITRFIQNVVFSGDSKTYYRSTQFDVSGASKPYAYTSYFDSDIITVYTSDSTITAYSTFYTDSTGSTSAGTMSSHGSGGEKVPTVETVNGVKIAYYTADDGHKIVLANQESNVAAIYAATGVAWYYILDTTNQRFKLPRSKHERYGDRPVVGNGKSLGLTDGTHTGSLHKYNDNLVPNGNIGVTLPATKTNTNPFTNDKVLGIVTDATKSGIISTPVEDTDQCKYLYFYNGSNT